MSEEKDASKRESCGNCALWPTCKFLERYEREPQDGDALKCFDFVADFRVNDGK